MVSAVIDLETNGTNPLEHRIIAIGVKIVETGETKVFSDYSEERVLKEFWEFVRKKRVKKLIGFNINNFDWQFIKLRSLKYGIKIKHFRKYKERIDLRQILNSNPYAKGRLDDYSRFFGLEVHDSITGKDVPKLWEEYLRGEEMALDEIIDHLLADLERTKYVYDRLVKCGLIREEYGIFERLKRIFSFIFL
ncbi:ribonuclease H-like domain-containing protein (plasmid) [Methanocaldococcus sp. 16A]